MAIDLRQDSLLTLSAAAQSLPGRPHVSTLHRWRLRGSKGIKLETVMIGGVRYTSLEALQKFVEQTTAAADGQPIPRRTKASRAASLARAEKRLAEFGV